MANKNQINAQLRNFISAANFANVADEAGKVAQNTIALQSSSLGGEIGENISGFESQNTGAGLSQVALVTDSLTGLSDQVVKDVSASQTDLNAITGSTVENGFLDFVVTIPTPEGVKAAINAIANPTPQQLETIISNILPKELKQTAADISQTATTFQTIAVELDTAVQKFSKQIKDLSGGVTGNLLQDIVLRTDKTPINTIEQLGLKVQQAGEILALLQKGELNKAIDQAVQLSGVDIAEVERILTSVNTKLSSQVSTMPVRPSSLPNFKIGSNTNKWNGKNTNTSIFTLVPTYEELLLEFLSSTREITEIIFYGYESLDNTVINANHIHQAAIDNGGNGIGFHYVVQPNGNLQRGRPVSRTGFHIREHTLYSIAVAIPHPVYQKATIEQGKTVDMMMRAFWHVWPGGQVFDAKKDITSTVDVGLNISSYLSKYKKINFGDSSRSYSTQQLIAAAQGGL